MIFFAPNNFYFEFRSYSRRQLIIPRLNRFGTNFSNFFLLHHFLNGFPYPLILSPISLVQRHLGLFFSIEGIFLIIMSLQCIYLPVFNTLIKPV